MQRPRTVNQRTWIRGLLVGLLACGGTDRANAQGGSGQQPSNAPAPEATDPEPTSPDPEAEGYLPPPQLEAVGARLINLATPFTFGRRGLDVLFTHRFSETVAEGSERDLFGLDSAADTGIGLTFGATRNLDLELYRSSVLETYELAAKLLVVRSPARAPVSIAVRAGVDLVHARGVADSQRPFAQALLAYRIGRGWSVFAAPTYVRDTPRLRDAWNVPFGCTAPLGGHGLLELEVVPPNDDVPDSEAAWHVAFSKSAGTHIFELTLGNSRATTVDQMIGGDFVGGFERDDVRIGFNLVRGFEF